MAFPNTSYTDILATTIEARSGKIADNATANNALLSYLKKRGNVRPFSGGHKILEEISFGAHANGAWYSGYDTLTVGASDNVSAAEFAIKQLAVPVVISGLEMLQNSGKEAIIDLMEARLKVAESTMANLISVGLYGDGTGSGGKTIVGLDSAVPVTVTNTYGGINRATAGNEFWKSQFLDSGAAASSSTIQGFMNTLYGQCVRGADAPDLIIAGGDAWGAFMASLQTLQRFTSADTAGLGFSAAKFMGADVVLDGQVGTAINTTFNGSATADTMYFLNTKYLHFRPHRDRNMVPLSPGKRVSVNQDAEVQILGWAGALTASACFCHGRLQLDA
jgi:hypothetical protein